MTPMKKYLKRAALVAAATGTLLAGTLGVLSINAVQEKIAVAVLKNAGVDARFGEWDSDFFSAFRLRNVSLKHGNGLSLEIPGVQIHANIFSILFTSDFSVEAEFETANRLQVAGKDFTIAVDRLALSNLAGAKNTIAGTLIPRKGENPPQAKFEFTSENRTKIRELALRDCLAGTRTAMLNFNGIECTLDESGAWEIADSNPDAPAISGSGIFHDGKITGVVDGKLDGEDFSAFGIGENLPVWRAESAITIDGDLTSESYSLDFGTELKIIEAAGTFSGVSLLPEIVLNGKGRIHLERSALALKTFFAEMAFAPENMPPVVFAEISVPGELGFAYTPEHGLEISAEGDASGLALLEFNNVPLALANPFIAKIPALSREKMPELSGTLNGSFSLTRNADGEFIFAGKDGLKLSDFAVKCADDVWFSGLSAKFPVVAFTRGNSVEFELKNAVVVGDSGIAFASADVSGSRDFINNRTGIEVSARIESAALSQKFFSEFFCGLSENKIAASATLKAEISDAEIDVSALRFSVFEGGEQARTLLAADTGAFRFDAENPFVGLDGKQIRLQANAFPLALIDPLARGKFFFSGTLDGEIAFVGEEKKVEFSTGERGMTIRDFRMENAKRLPLLSGLSLRSVENLVRVSRAENGRFQTEVGLKNARLKNTADKRLASGDLYLNFNGKKLMTLRGDVFGELGNIARQPLFLPVGNLAGGTLEMHGGWDALNQLAKLEIDGRNLSSRDRNPVRIAGLNLKFEHNAEPGAEIVARVQASLEGSERSSADLRFTQLDFDRREDAANFDADLLVEKIVLADCLALAEILSPEKVLLPVVATQALSNLSNEDNVSGDTGKTPSVPERKTSADEVITPVDPEVSRPKSAVAAKPELPAIPESRVVLPWENVTGTAKFRILECVVPENRLQNIFGTLNLSPERGELTAESDEFFGGTLKSKTVLETRNQSSFFSKTKIAVKDSRIYDAVPALRGRDPAVIEGKFAFDLSAEAEAKRLEDLSRQLSAKASVLGKNGRVRIFAVDNENVRNVGNLAQIGGGVAELAGMFGGKKVRRIAKAARRLQEYLSDFPFDVHEIRLSYDAGNPVVCEKFLLRNNLLKISGAGEIAYSEDLPLGDAPLAIRARMDVREELEELMATLGILKSAEHFAEPGEPAYTVGPEFELSGTLNRFSDNLLETLLSAGIGI